MIELFQIDALDIQEKFISFFCFLLSAEFNEKITDMKLFESEQFFNSCLQSSSIEPK